MGDSNDEGQQPGERQPVGDWQPFVEFRFRWDPYRKQHVVTKRGLTLAPSWEECPDLDYLVVSVPGRGSREVAVGMVRTLNGQRTPEQIPPAVAVTP